MRTAKRHHIDRHARRIIRDTRKHDRNGLLTVQEAADLLRVSKAFLDSRRCSEGGPAFLRLGSRVFYRPIDLRRWLRTRIRSSTKDRRDTKATT